MKGLVFALAALIATMAAARSSRAADAGETLIAQQVVHLLDYVAADYAGAVSGGVIVNPKEHAEQIEVLAEAARLASKLKSTSTAREPREEVLRVKQLVEQTRPEAEVIAVARAVRGDLAVLFDVTETPRDIPSRARGRELYLQHCATCHGEEGRADTARAAQYSPRPANFLAPEVARRLSPARVFATTRFGVPKTAMVPFDFLNVGERWDIAFYTSGLDHAVPVRAARREVLIFGIGDLAEGTDDDLRDDLRSVGIGELDVEGTLAELRTVAPYEPDATSSQGGGRMALRARASLKRVGVLVARGDRDGARTRLLATYLDDVEPFEASLRGTDPVLTRDIETQFKEIRAEIDRGAPDTEINRKLYALGALLGRAGRSLESDDNGARSFYGTVLSSAGLALREGVEAALLIAALLAIVGRSGAPERKRWVHIGWTSAVMAGVATWFLTRRFVESSGLGREMLEGIAALIAASVLFYVSYWLFAKREAARWMSYLRQKAGSGRAAVSLFGIAFLAVYREAFETILFYQPIIVRPGAATPAALGALVGAGLLAMLVVAYGRAGKFAPPRSFFAFSTLLLYALAVVFAGQGISALQTTGHIPLHPVSLPHLPALGVYPTIETYSAQIVLVSLAVVAALVMRFQRPPPGPPEAPGSGIAGSREGVKL